MTMGSATVPRSSDASVFVAGAGPTPGQPSSTGAGKVLSSFSWKELFEMLSSFSNNFNKCQKYPVMGWGLARGEQELFAIPRDGHQVEQERQMTLAGSATKEQIHQLGMQLACSAETKLVGDVLVSMVPWRAPCTVSSCVVSRKKLVGGVTHDR
jgi:hypothetical protein